MNSPRAEPAVDRTIIVVTGVIALGLLLTTLPLRSIFTDWGWLSATIAAAAPYWIIVTFFRTRSAPLWWHSLLGLLGSVLVLTWIFVPQNLAFGIVPTPASLSDIGALIRDARGLLQSEHAPLASTTSLRFMTAGLMVLLAALTDILGVGLRRPLLAAAPMLEILAVASTTSSRPSQPIWFASAAVGFLLIVLAGTRLQDRAWGPAVDGSAGRLGGARVIAVTGIAAALMLPIALPGRSANLLAKATHHSGTGGTGGRVVLSNLASLRGTLTRGTPVNLLQVKIQQGINPFYIRQAVLNQFTADGWVQSPPTSQDLITLAAQSYYSLPGGSTDGGETAELSAQFTVLALGGTNLPILANPTDLPASLPGSWDRGTSTVQGQDLKQNQTYTETAAQPSPNKQQLEASTAADPAFVAPYLTRAAQDPSVTALAKKITASQATPYDKALAISNYFTDGKNGFTYSLTAPAPDGRSGIVTFLDKKQGFCQQYAATAAVLMREAGLPSRVVIGYTHSAPDSSGTFTVTTLDAHAWVEVYFDNIGWIPFDPTPLTGADAARAVALPYAPHTTAPASSAPSRNVGSSAASVAVPKAQPRLSSAVPTLGAAAKTQRSHWATTSLSIVAVLLLVGLLVFGPRSLRKAQRRRRLTRALRMQGTELLWQELAASALDQNVLWPETLTVAQVPSWLSNHGLDERGTVAVTTLADQVQLTRFSQHPEPVIGGDDVAGLDQALRRWARKTERRQQIVYRWIPRSLLRKGPTRRR